MKIGAAQYTLCMNEVEGMELVGIASDLGVNGIEPYFGTIHDTMLNWSESQIKEFVTMAEHKNVQLPSVAVGIFNNDPALIESDKQDHALEILQRCIHFTEALHAKTMLLCTYLASEPNTPAKKGNLLKIIKAVEPFAKQQNVAIALESPLSAGELIALTDAADSKSVGVYYDVGNAVALGFDPAVEIQTLGNRILSVHIKDSVNKLGALHLGKGHVNLFQSMQTLKEIHYDGWLILETPGDNMEALRKEIDALRKYL